MDELYRQNWDKFALMCPSGAIQMQNIDCSSLEFCTTAKGELNLQRTQGKVPYHSQEGALEEARQWANEIFPIGIKVIFVYGIGLGYAYDALSDWLKDDPGRYLIFMEDDLAVLHRFLETDRAALILNDSQVVVEYFPTPGERDWGKFRQQFDWYFWGFAGHKIAVHALKLYAQEKSAMLNLLRGQMHLNMQDIQLTKVNHLDLNESIYFNFYHSVAQLDKAGFACRLFEDGLPVPALICGAGPSLTKQLPMLRTLGDRALIIGSGTGLNILNRHGISPHFGLAVDPNVAQESRLLTNTSYELPFFFAHRFYQGAMIKIHGPRLYVNGGVAFQIGVWFDNAFGLPSYDAVGSGVSTSNFGAGVAHALHNHPIVLVGMDMAYTEASRYAPGVTAHPTDNREQHQAISKISENAIPGIDVNGASVMTRWDWVVEADVYTQFVRHYPEAALINATEGGLRILEVPHLTLEEVAKNYLTTSFDIPGWVHAEIEASYALTPSFEKVGDVLRQWKKSLENCCEALKVLVEEVEGAQDRFAGTDLLSSDLLTGRMALLLEELGQESAYLYFLHDLDVIFDKLAAPEMNKLRFHPEEFQGERLKKILILRAKGRYQFLRHYAELHLRLVEDALQSRKKQAKVEGHISETQVKEAHYSFEKGLLKIHDPELGIDIEEEFRPLLLSEERKKSSKHEKGFITAERDVFEGEALLFYPSGQVKGQTFYGHGKDKGKRHGPSTFFSENGTVLSKSWFWNDQRIGKSLFYTLSGNLHSLLRYREGALHGRQEYYFPHGGLKTVMHYQDGLLDGEVLLYYPNGSMKRQIQFAKGLLNGFEKYWDESGQLIIEAEYQNGLPKGKSRAWHANGRLAKEIIFYENPFNFDLYLWDEGGRLIKKQLSLPDKPLEDMIKKSKEIMESLDKAAEQLEQVKQKKNLA